MDFSSVAVDLEGVDLFRRAIYQAARKLGFGQTTTYGGLADAAGQPGKARETGEALGRNPVPIIVPCHRIVAAGGKIGGFSAPGGSATKKNCWRWKACGSARRRRRSRLSGSEANAGRSVFECRRCPS